MNPLSLPERPTLSLTRGWHNFVTGQTDWRSSAPETDEEAEQYLPQWPEALNYYQILRAAGRSVDDASIEVLKRVTGFQEPA